MFIAPMSTIAKLWKEPRCPLTDEWIKKMWYLYTMEYYAAIKNETLPFTTDMDITRGYYAKQNKSIRERQLSYDLTDMQNLRNKAE